MKVLRLHGVRDLQLHDESDPASKQGEVPVRMASVGLCGPDRSGMKLILEAHVFPI